MAIFGGIVWNRLHLIVFFVATRQRRREAFLNVTTYICAVLSLYECILYS